MPACWNRGRSSNWARKADALLLSESLAEELRGTGVTVTALCAGITATAMFDHARQDNARVAQLRGFRLRARRTRKLAPLRF